MIFLSKYLHTHHRFSLLKSTSQYRKNHFFLAWSFSSTVFFFRSSIASQDSLELQSEIPPAPPLDPLISLSTYTDQPNLSKLSQKDLIVTAKSTLKRRTPRKSTDFQFYVNETDFSDIGSDLDSLSLASEEDFAGSKSPKISEGNLTIRSHRGTVRGVKNRVRAGIATFLRDPCSKVSLFYFLLTSELVFYAQILLLRRCGFYARVA